MDKTLIPAKEAWPMGPRVTLKRCGLRADHSTSPVLITLGGGGTASLPVTLDEVGVASVLGIASE